MKFSRYNAKINPKAAACRAVLAALSVTDQNASRFTRLHPHKRRCAISWRWHGHNTHHSSPSSLPSNPLTATSRHQPNEGTGKEKPSEWKKEISRERCSMVTSPLEARERILDSTFSWRGLERRNKRLLACQRRTAMHLNREDEDGKGELLWWIPLVCFQRERPPLSGRRCGGTR